MIAIETATMNPILAFLFSLSVVHCSHVALLPLRNIVLVQSNLYPNQNLQSAVSASLPLDGSATPWLQPYGAGPCLRELTNQDCPLFDPTSDMVTPNTLKTLLTASEWINLYTFEIKSDDNFGKCRYRFTPKDGDVYFKRLTCYNLSKKKCDNFDADVRVVADSCGRAKLESASGSPAEYDLFYSQEPNVYMWQDICFGPTPEGGCAGRYFDLLIRADRIDQDQVAILTGLPFDKISVDLGKVMRKEFVDPAIRFNWIEQECPL